MIIVIATHNPDKRREILPLLEPLDIQLQTLQDHPQIGEIVEDGITLEANALIKARTVHQITGLPALADDTGLEVDALNGAPGVYSARYAGEPPSYEANVDRLLNELTTVPETDRTARFRTVVAYVDDHRELLTEGIVKGLISTERKGVGGFGYDPVFYVPDRLKTFAEMKTEEKNRISHRGIALRRMCSALEAHPITPKSSQKDRS